MDESHLNESKHKLKIGGDIYFSQLASIVPQMFSFIDPIDYTLQYINKVEPGYDKQAVIGQSIFNFILPEHHEVYVKAIDKVKSTKETVKIDVGFLSYQFPNGITWCRTTVSGVYNEQSELHSLLILSEDITESKLLEIENNNQSERLKAIINNTYDMICSIDVDFNLIEFNASLANIVRKGYDVELERGMPILDYIDPRKHSDQKTIYKSVLKGETKYVIDEYDLSSGETMYVESSYHPIYDINEEISGISIFSKNITERIKSEQKIKVALKEKEVLLSEIHHRIKNNLAMVSSLLQLKELNIENEEAKLALNSSIKRIKTTALIHELLYRNDTFHDINLKAFIQELFDLLKTKDSIQLALKGNELLLNLTTALPLGLILNELMMNSFKYTYSDGLAGKTEINIGSVNENLIIEYCDCRGSFPTNIDFNKSNSTGLTLIHTFIEQLNGSIELVKNTPPFYKIEIPMA